MHLSNEKLFVNNTKTINAKSNLETNFFNYKFDFNNKNLSSLEKNNSSIFSAPIFPLKKEAKTQHSNFHKISLYQIQIIQKMILSCFKSQTNTKNLQANLIFSSKENIDIIVNALSGSYKTIIKDKNGNYFCTDLFKVCEQNQRIKILYELMDSIGEDCCDKYGSYPIQTLIDFSSCEKEYELLLHSFNDYNRLLYASLDPIGSYTIQKIIEHIPEKFRNKFNFNFISMICFISIKKYGIINAKKFISCTKNEENINQIINLVSNNFMIIAVNNYGNYLIQHILEKWNNVAEIKKIKIKIIDNYLFLLKNKYSNYICHLFINLAKDEDKQKLKNILNLNDTNNEIINNIIMKNNNLVWPNYSDNKKNINVYNNNKFSTRRYNNINSKMLDFFANINKNIQNTNVYK
jgi:hypothetical protein